MSLYTAIVTPFDNEGNVDLESFENLVKEQFSNGVDGIVIFGSTGESFSLTFEEKIGLINKLRLVLDSTEKYTFDNVIIGFAGSNTAKVIADMNQFNDTFPDYRNYMLSAPSYCKPTQEGIYQHYSQVMSSFWGKQFMIYNIPSRTGVNILPETITRICIDNPNHFGIKEASGSLDQARELINNYLPVYSGDDSAGFDVVKMGGKGLVSVLANWLPFEMKQAITNEKLNQDLSDLYKLEFIESNPVPIKYFMFKYGIIKCPNVRLPLVNLSPNAKNKLDMYKLKNKVNYEEVL